MSFTNESLKVNELSILDSLPVRLICIDKSLRIIFINKYFEKHPGKFSEFLNIGGVAIHSNWNIEYWTECFFRAFDGAQQTEECVFQTKDNIDYEKLTISPVKSNDEILHLSIVFQDITSYKENLNIAGKYKKYVDNSLAGFFRTTLTGKFIECNAAFARILGYESVDEVMHQSVYDIYFTEEERNNYLSKLKERGFLQNYESRHKRKDGSEIWILTNVMLGYDVNEQPAYVEGTFIDISDLKTAGEYLLESEERFREISEIISDYAYSLILDKDGNYKINWIFGGFESITGYNPDEIIKELNGYNRVIHPDDFIPLADDAMQLIRTGRSDRIYRIIDKKGTVKWVKDVAKILKKENGFYIIIGAVKDVTFEQLREFDLRRTEASLRGLLDNLPSGMFILKNEELVYQNTVLSKIICGYEKKLEREEIKAFLSAGMYKRVCSAFDKFERLPEQEFSKNINRTNKQYYIIQGVPLLYGEEPSYCIVIQQVTLTKQLTEEKIRLKIAQETNEALEREIREHRLTQKKLKGAERFSKYIIDSSIDMILASDIKGGITEINHAALRRFGYSQSDLIGKDPRILYRSKKEYETVFNALNTKGFYRGEVTNVTSNGEIFKSMLSASLLKSDDGKIVGAMGVSRDITELKKAERILLEQSSMIRAIFEGTSNTMIWTIDKLFRLVTFNKNFRHVMESRFGIICEKGDSILEIASRIVRKSENYEAMQAFFDRSVAGETIEFEGPLRDLHGKTVWLELFLNPVDLKDEEFKEVVCLAHDITDKKQAEKRLKQSEERLQAMFNALPDSILRVNSKGIILNGKLYRNSQLSVELENKKIQDIFGKENRDRFIKAFQKVLKEKRESNLEIEYSFFKEEANQYLEARLSPINEDEILMIVRNITQEKLVEQQIFDSLREKEILLKEVHHRVKNNLQIISSILNLQSSYVTDENTIEILRESQNRIKSMSFIHESLYQNKNFSTIKFSEYLLNLCNNLIHSYQLSDVLLDTDFRMDDYALNLDQAIPCGLIVNELITNSIKYAFRGRANGKITVHFTVNNSRAELRIFDNGVGLPKTVDFRNTESLGLQLVVTLVEQLGGEIEELKLEGTGYLITFVV
jgi:PAS domain S-box-containing protein